jgi:uncharacterized membrane protein
MRALWLWTRTVLLLVMVGGVAGFLWVFFLLATAMNSLSRGSMASISCAAGALVGGSVGYMLLARIQNRPDRL